MKRNEAFGETTLDRAIPPRILDLCGYLKHEEKFVRLSAVTAVDWYPAEPRFEVVYHLHSIEQQPAAAGEVPAFTARHPEIESVYCRVARGQLV